MISLAEYPVLYPRMYTKEERMNPPASSSISSYEGIKACVLDTSDSDADNKYFHYSAKLPSKQVSPKQVNEKHLVNGKIQDESVMCWLLEQFVQNGTKDEKPHTDEVKSYSKTKSSVSTKYQQSNTHSRLSPNDSPHKLHGSDEKQQWMSSLPQLNKTRSDQHHFSRLSRLNLTGAERCSPKGTKHHPIPTALSVEKIFDEIESQMATLESQNLLILKQLRKAEAIINDCKDVQRGLYIGNANHSDANETSKAPANPTSLLRWKENNDDAALTLVNTEIQNSSDKMNPNSHVEYHPAKKHTCLQTAVETVVPVASGKDYKSFCPEIPTRRFSVAYYPQPKTSPTDSSPDSTHIQCDRSAFISATNTPKLDRYDRAHSLIPDTERITRTKIAIQQNGINNDTCQNEMGLNGTQNVTMKGFVTMMRRPFRRKGNCAAMETAPIQGPNKVVSNTRCISTGDVKKTGLSYYGAVRETNMKNLNYQYVTRVRSNEDVMKSHHGEANRAATQMMNDARPKTNEAYTRRPV